MGGPGSGSKPKQYPSDLVESVRRLYVDRGMSQVEVADALATTQKVIYNLMRRHNISRRRQVKREQAGSANSTWRGDEAGYAALHKRVETARGRPRICDECGSTSAVRYLWANLTGRYQDINDYRRMCASCHGRFDAARRSATGRNTSPFLTRPALTLPPHLALHPALAFLGTPDRWRPIGRGTQAVWQEADDDRLHQCRAVLATFTTDAALRAVRRIDLYIAHRKDAS